MKIHNLEQNSPEWDLIRLGKPTASEFKKLVTGTGQPSKSITDYARTLAAELYASALIEKWEGNQWTERGHEMEVKAVEEYELITGAELQPAGFITDDGESYGCSPDRLVGNSGLLEIKSLAAHRHIEALQYIAKHGNIQLDYRTQVQGQLLVCEREWCDILFFHPALPSKTVRIYPIAEIHEKLKERIAAVIRERDSILQFLENDAA